MRQYSWVVFKRDNIDKNTWDEYYKPHYEDEYGDLKLFVFLGENPMVKGHCFIADPRTGLMIGMIHTEDLREAKEEEYCITINLDEEE